jgi:hypothetical protein
VRWDRIDDRTSRATLTDRGTKVSMEVRFGDGRESYLRSAQADVLDSGIPTTPSPP